MTNAVNVAKLGNGPLFWAQNGSTQNLSNGVFTKAALSTELYDTNSCFDATTNYRFTPTVAGYYQFNTYFYFGSGAAYEQITQIYLNGASYGNYTSDVVGVISRATNGSKMLYLNGSTDYVELYVYINVAAAVAAGAIEFQGFFVRGA